MKRLKIQTLLFAALVGLASTCFVSCGSSDDTSMSQQAVFRQGHLLEECHQQLFRLLRLVGWRSSSL